MNKISVALSGGGHRATAFSLGALMYLVDCGRNKDVRTITSVSGGSLTNAYLASLNKPFNDLTRGEFRIACAQLANQISGRPVIFRLSWVIYILFWAGIWLLPGPQLHSSWSISLLLFITLIVVWSVLVGPWSGGALWGWWGTWLYVGLLIAGVVAIPVTWWLLNAGCGWALLVIGAVLLALSRRHVVAGMAFGAALRFPSSNAYIRLDRTQESGVRHIFCATELHVGRHMFFSRDFVYTKDFGLGVPGSLRLGDAAQLSANFPGGFPFRRLCTSRFRLVGTGSQSSKSLAFTDGGVYDNTATSWYLDSEEIVFK